ncbi:uncharacterized protein NPIL_641171 [Nephila pilipes]|uniref:Uncharacterized protein n=1 Tax=Nephila pilipes TaxID=299642 RepID=A0A8X6UUQ8_NEPPI|nr:uncharacterized protein NPIL_641171 [Nephila pilipes]
MPQLEAQFKIPKKILDKFEVLNEDYYKSASDEEYLTIEASLSEIDQEIQHLEVRIKTSINKKKLYVFKVIDTVQSSEKLSSFDSSRRINLQPIPLLVFTGRLDEFNSFKSKFITLIHNNKELTDSEKLLYLRDSLKGEAKTIETPDDSYLSLFSGFRKEIRKQKMLVECHIKAF